MGERHHLCGESGHHRPEGSIIRRLTFDSFSITRYSGAAPAPDPDAAGYKNQYLWLKMGPDGQVADWKGLDGIKSYTSEGRSLTDVLVTQMTLLYQPLPKDPVTVGSTWQNNLEMPVTMRGSGVQADCQRQLRGHRFRGESPAGPAPRCT